MIDRPNTTTIGQDREILTFKALLYVNVAVYEQVCRLFCVGCICQCSAWFRQDHGFISPCGSYQLPVYLKYSVRLKLLAQLVHICILLL